MVTHLADPVTEVEYGVEVSPGEDFSDYRLKVERWVRDHANETVVYKLRHNQAMSAYEFKELERIFTQELGNEKDYERTYGDTPFGLLVRKLIKLDRAAANEAFAEFINTQALNDRQISFIRKVVDYVVENGYMEAWVLTKPPFDRPSSFSRTFNTQQQMSLVAAINKIKQNAEVPAA